MEGRPGLDFLESYSSGDAGLIGLKYSLVNLYDQKSGELPEFDLSCKFVLIQNETELFMVFGSLSEYKYHANLAAKFCDIKDVPYHWVKNPDLIEILDNAYKIKGGGLMRLLTKSKRVEFGGHSTAYGKYDKGLLKQFISESPVFQGYEIIIGT